MRVVIVGGGEVGFHLASVLSQESHEVTVVDQRPGALERFREALDVETLEGHGGGLATLRKAGAGTAELFVAVTNDDEVNMLACLGAKELGARTCVARVGNPVYLEGTRAFYRNLLGIDLVVSPEVLAALEVTKAVKAPGALTLEKLLQGGLQARQYRVQGGSPLTKKRIRDLDLPRDLLLAAIHRDHEILIPTGSDRLRSGDDVLALGTTQSLEVLKHLAGSGGDHIRRVLLVGGGRVGVLVAQLLEQEGVQVRLIERDAERCRELSETLRRTTVLHGDGTDLNLLKTEGVDSADLFAPLSGQDEVNLLSGMLAKELGARHVVVLIHRPDYGPIIERLGVDQAISPRILTAQTILRHVTRDRALLLASLPGGSAGLYEIRTSAKAKGVGKPLRELELPPGTLVAAVLKEDEATIPRGTDPIPPGATLLLFSKNENVRAVEKTFIG
jgi:trk system potassium uptake protein TrkA